MIIPTELEQIIGVVAGVLTLFTQGTYFFSLIRRKVKPSILSWFGWALLMGVSLYSQVISKGWEWNQIGLLISSIACILIPAFAIIWKNYLLQRKDWIFLILGLICLAIYIKSKDPWLTTIYAILADFLLTIPTIIKTYKYPESERTKAWYFGLTSWALALIISVNHDFIYALFPIYLFLFNLMMIFLTQRKCIKSE